LKISVLNLCSRRYLLSFRNVGWWRAMKRTPCAIVKNEESCPWEIRQRVLQGGSFFFHQCGLKRATRRGHSFAPTVSLLKNGHLNFLLSSIHKSADFARAKRIKAGHFPPHPSHPFSSTLCEMIPAHYRQGSGKSRE
jgi:hypothetical protein